jgi:hypothetical protein
VQQFRQLAREQKPNIPMTFPMAEVVGLLQEGVGHLLREAGLALMHLRSGGLLKWTAEQFSSVVTISNSRFNSHGLNLLAAILSVLIGRWLILARSHHILWWGSPTVSRIGYCTAVYVATIVWYQLLLHNFKGITATILSWQVFTRGVELDPFHADGVYGLGDIAQLLLLAYATTLIHCMAVLALWRGHFFNTNDSAVLLFIPFFFVVFIPLFFAVPYTILRRAIKASKRSLRQRARSAAGWPPSDNNLVPLLLADRLVDELPNHPFSRRMIAISTCGYALQIIASIITIVQVAANKH